MHPFFADLTREHWAKSVPPITNCFMANIYASFMEQIFNITKRKWKSDIHHHGETDDLRRRLKVAKWVAIRHLGSVGWVERRLKPICSDGVDGPALRHRDVPCWCR